RVPRARGEAADRRCSRPSADRGRLEWRSGAVPVSTDATFVAGPGDVALSDLDLDRLDPIGTRAEPAVVAGRAHPPEYPPGQELSGRVAALEFRDVVEIAVVDFGERRFQHVRGTADVDDDRVLVELGPAELDVDHEGGPVQPLGRPKHLAPEAVRD